MNNTFNLNRFVLLLRKTLMERPMQLFGFTALILLFSFLMYSICKQLIGFTAAQNLSFMWGFIGGSCFLASFMFSYFSSNASGSSYLTLPASQFEKWLCGILIGGILFPLIFLLAYRLIDLSYVTLYHNSLDPMAPFYKERYEAVYIFPFDGIVAKKVYPMFFFFTGAMFVGSLYFNKVAFIKVALLMCLFCLGMYGLNWMIAKSLFQNLEDAFPFNNVAMKVGKQTGSIDLPKNAQLIFSYALCYVVPALLWLLTYVRLREKEF